MPPSACAVTLLPMIDRYQLPTSFSTSKPTAPKTAPGSS
jgi:hypothetical protein